MGYEHPRGLGRSRLRYRRRLATTYYRTEPQSTPQASLPPAALPHAYARLDAQRGPFLPLHFQKDWFLAVYPSSGSSDNGGGGADDSTVRRQAVATSADAGSRKVWARNESARFTRQNTYRWPLVSRVTS